MDMLENILSREVVHKLGWTLLHSLWQGVVVLLLLVVLLRVLRKSSANLRYVFACLGLVMVVLLPVVTFYLVPVPAPDVESVPGFSVPVTDKLYEVYDTDMPLQRAAEYMQIPLAISWKQRAKDFCASILPYIVFGWFIGVLALSLWHLGGWAHLQRLKRKKVNHVDVSLKDSLHNLAERLKVSRPVKLMESALVQIPTVVGWLWPVILLPASALTGLSREQLEALLAHELAHIRRYDYLVNMFQTLVEILGFYHPAIWWISHKMRVERENCCDDLAVSVGGDKMAYARALTTMEEIRQDQGELVIAAGGGNLFTRISRLVGYESSRKARHVWTSVVLSALLIIVLAIPATLALTAGGLRADNITTHVSELADEENISSSVDRQSTSHLPDINSKTQILFDCKFFKVPADLEIIEGWPKPVDKQFIDVDRVYTDRLEELCQEREDVKLLVAPRILVVNGKQATMSAPGAILKVAGIVRDNAVKVNLFLELKNDTVTSVVMSKPEETIIVGGLLDSNNLNQSIIITITPHIVASKELADTSIKVEQDRVKHPCVAAGSAESGELGETAAKTQILFECKIYEVPIDLKFFGGEQKEDGQIIWFGKEYADFLETLNQKTKNAKVLSSPRILVLEGEEASMDIVHEIPYKAGYESATKVGNEPKPIVKFLSDGIKLKLKSHTVDSSTIRTELRLTQSKTSFTTQKDSQGREIQIPVVASSVCTTDVTVPSQTPVVIGGLKSQNNDNSQLLLVITPSIVLPEKSIERKVETDQRLLKQDETMLRYKALEEQTVELQQMLNEIQTKLAELEKRKAELSQLNKLNSALASPKEQKSGDEPGYHTVRLDETLSLISKKYYGSENKWQKILNYNREIITADGIQVGQRLIIPPLKTSEKEAETEHERLAAMAAKFAERGDFAKAIENLEEAIELARVEKDYGIGIAIAKADGLIRIGQLFPNAPASTSSLRQGDIIKAIDGVSTEGMSLNEVVARIRGPKGTKVTLKVKCHSQDITMEETFTRQLPLKGSPVLQEYYWRLDAYEAGKTWPQYREMMKNYQPLPEKTVRIFELKYVSAKEMAGVLNRILESRSKGIKDKPKEIVEIIPDPGHKKLIIHASPNDIQLIEALIAEFDVIAKQNTVVLKAIPSTEANQDAPVESTITKIINLRYADCESVAQILQQLISDKQLKIVPDKRTNMLLVAGTESAIQKILSLVAELDVPSREDTTTTTTKTSPSSKLTPDTPDENIIYEIIQLKYSDCESVSEKVAKILSADQQFQIIPFKDTNRLLMLGSESIVQEIKVLVAEIDVQVPDKNLEIGEPEI